MAEIRIAFERTGAGYHADNKVCFPSASGRSRPVGYHRVAPLPVNPVGRYFAGSGVVRGQGI